MAGSRMDQAVDWSAPKHYALGVALNALLIGAVKRDGTGWRGHLNGPNSSRLRVILAPANNQDGEPMFCILLDPADAGGLDVNTQREVEIK